MGLRHYALRTHAELDAIERENDARRCLAVLRSLLADPDGAQGLACLLEEQGWRCEPPKPAVRPRRAKAK